MPEDPIVEEIHKVRQALLDEYGGLDGYIQHLADLRTEFKDRIVQREPRKPVLTKQKAS